ncbi:MAG: AAA family ATPase, partial [candidate division WOR-3 bacterium]
MLKFLRVKNFALMEELVLNFEKGLTVITGETGAGKSMIVDAIAALCGERIEDISIRTGKDYAEITGILESTADSTALLKKYNIETNEEIIIRRRIEKGKRQFAYINDQLVSLLRLKEITQGLVDLVGQHENQSLFSVSNHLKLLDHYARIENLLSEYQRIFYEYNKFCAELNELEKLRKDKEQKLENLRFEINEIEKANLKINEEASLAEEKNLLQTGEKRANLIDEILPRLYEAESSIYENLAVVQRLTEELSKLDSRSEIKNLKSIIETSISNIEEVYRQLIDYREHIDFSRERFEEVMERMDLIYTLKKKYRKDIPGILEYFDHARNEIEKLEKTDYEIEKLQSELQVLTKQLNNLAQELSKKRKSTARMMEKEIVKILNRL